MLRIHRCFDLLEAHIIVALMRDEGIAAQVFDADFVRQDWIRMLAYGGFRVMVPDAAAGDARAILHRYRNGELAFEDDDDHVRCPRCAAEDVADDPQPRRNIFLGYMLFALIWGFALVRWDASEFDIFAMFLAQIPLALGLPWLLIRYFKWRMGCANCGHRWRERPRYRHGDLALLAAAGERKML